MSENDPRPGKPSVADLELSIQILERRLEGAGKEIKAYEKQNKIYRERIEDLEDKYCRLKVLVLSMPEAGRLTPSAIYRPNLTKDGNAWCALYGDNLQSGVCGFGDTPAEAMEAFDEAWSTRIG